MLGAVGFLIVGFVRLYLGLVSVFMLLVSLGFAIISLLLFLFGVLTQQGNMLQVEIWRLRQHLDQSSEN